MEEDKQVILQYLDLIEPSTISWRNGGRRRDRIKLRETLNSLEGEKLIIKNNIIKHTCLPPFLQLPPENLESL